MKNLLTIKQSAELIKRGVSADKASAAVIYLDYAGEEVEPHKVFKREGDGVLLTRLRNGTVIGVEAKMVHKDSDCKYSESIFALTDLLSLLPKKIDDTYRLKIQSCDWPTWTVCYTDFQSGAKGWHQSMELIDALYKLMIWAIDNHVKLD